MKKTPKKYPMDGPPLWVQQAMQRPALNRQLLQAWAKENPSMRPDTLAACCKVLHN